MPNIVLEVMSGMHPMRVALQQVDGVWKASIIGVPEIEVYAETFHQAIEKAAQRFSVAVDNVA